MSDRDLPRLTARFEVAVANFVRSTFDLAANEKAFQAWYAASVIHGFGLSRVYRKVHLRKSQLRKVVSAEMMTGFDRGNELFPDLSVSWSEAIDARSTAARPPEFDAAGMLKEFGIVSELKVASSTRRSTPPSGIRTDLRKLGEFAEAQRAGNTGSDDPPMATYLVILDNHRDSNGNPTSHYRPGRIESLLERTATTWPAGVPMPTVLVGGSVDGAIGVTKHPPTEPSAVK